VILVPESTNINFDTPSVSSIAWMNVQTQCCSNLVTNSAIFVVSTVRYTNLIIRLLISLLQHIAQTHKSTDSAHVNRCEAFHQWDKWR